MLALDPIALGREMFEATSDLEGVPAGRDRHARRQGVRGRPAGSTIAIAQVETVGQGLDDRRDELLAAIDEARERRGYQLFALMVTDILAKDTDLYVAGDAGPLELAFGTEDATTA